MSKPSCSPISVIMSTQMLQVNSFLGVSPPKAQESRENATRIKSFISSKI